MSKAGEALGLGADRKAGPLPPKYTPKVTIRVTCGRSKQIMEYSVDIPVDGTCHTSFANAHEKLNGIFQRLGILDEPTEEENHGEKENSKEKIQNGGEKRTSSGEVIDDPQDEGQDNQPQAASGPEETE